jgi:hypothetical protein
MHSISGNSVRAAAVTRIKSTPSLRYAPAHSTFLLKPVLQVVVRRVWVVEPVWRVFEFAAVGAAEFADDL